MRGRVAFGPGCAHQPALFQLSRTGPCFAVLLMRPCPLYALVCVPPRHRVVLAACRCCVALAAPRGFCRVVRTSGAARPEVRPVGGRVFALRGRGRREQREGTAASFDETGCPSFPT